MYQTTVLQDRFGGPGMNMTICNFSCSRLCARSKREARPAFVLSVSLNEIHKCVENFMDRLVPNFGDTGILSKALQD